MEKLIIPERINVGFQTRKDTYTGKLGYIIYWDSKGVLRKQTSWDGWREKSIPNQEFKNEPTEGFVLNKKVGDYRSDFGHRSAHIRIYDPRDFEFEITVENLLYILANCDCTKGKGLEGKFVYAWDGKDLFLLPVNTVEYRKSTNFTDLQTMKVSKSDMVVGCHYTFKDKSSGIYLGKFNLYDTCYIYEGDDDNNITIGTKIEAKQKHVFYLDKKISWKHNYRFETGFTKVATRDTETPCDNIAELIVDYESSIYGGKMIGWELSKEYYDIKLLTKKEIKEGRYHYWEQNEWDEKIKSDFAKVKNMTHPSISEDKNTLYNINYSVILCNGKDIALDVEHDSVFTEKTLISNNGIFDTFLDTKTYSNNYNYGRSYRYTHTKNFSYNNIKDKLQNCNDKTIRLHRAMAILENGTRVDLLEYIDIHKI